VLCAACEFAALDGRPHYLRRIAYLASLDRAAEVICPEGDLLAVCDKCRAACWVESGVALLQRVGFAATELGWENGAFAARLEQTGGMCAALVLTGPNERIQVVVTALDGEFVVGRYLVESDDDDSWGESTDSFVGDPLYEDGALISELVEEAARVAVEFLTH